MGSTQLRGGVTHECVNWCCPAASMTVVATECADSTGVIMESRKWRQTCQAGG